MATGWGISAPAVGVYVGDTLPIRIEESAQDGIAIAVMRIDGPNAVIKHERCRTNMT
jgi:hypothetical protein